MIIFGALIVVLIVTLVFYLRNPKEYKWWEFGVPLLVTLLLIIGAKAIMDHSAVQFTEYWGESIVSVHEEEPWNEWITETCSREYACGTDSEGNTTYCTEYYDCSYQDDHGPSWYCITDLGNRYGMSEHLHDSLVAVYGTGKKVTKTRKNHSSRDGAVYSQGTKFQNSRVGPTSRVFKTTWPKVEKSRKGVFTEHSYENRVKASDLSIFNIPVVTEEEADSMGLFKYEYRIDKYKCPTIRGAKVSHETQEMFRNLNAKFGVSKHLRLWILVFEDKDPLIAKYQENYWVKGNQNELVVCIGKKGNEIQWAHSFSWAMSGALTAEVASKVLEMYEYTIETTDGEKIIPIVMPDEVLKNISDQTGVKVDLKGIIPIPIQQKGVKKITKSKAPILTDKTWQAYADYLNKNLHRFERRQFIEEFSYVKTSPKTWHIVVVYILALFISVGLNIWVSTNEIHDK